MRSTDVDQVLPIVTRVPLWLSVTKIMTFGRFKTVSNTLIRCPIVFDEINTLCDFVNFVENLSNQTQTQKVLISLETMGYRMRTFDTVLKISDVIHFENVTY